MKVIVSNPIDNNVAEARIVDGVIVINEKKPEFGSIMFESKTISISGGFANNNRRVCFLGGEIATLREVAKTYKLKAGEVILDHKIIVRETLEPQFEGHAPKINPSTTKEVTKNGAYIYRNTYLEPSNSEVVDSFIQHDTVSAFVANDVDASIMNKLTQKENSEG